MFGLPVGQIVRGHFNEVTQREQKLYEKRIAICYKCPLYTKGKLGDTCDAKKCVDPEKQDEIFQYPKPRAICGCGCRLSAKARLEDAKCVLNKW